MVEQSRHVPFVSSETNMAEFTVRALIIGLVLSVVIGAANAYVGLKAGMTIAATYPAAIIGMALLRIMKGTILEENFARTVGSNGSSLATAAIFTIPSFYIAGVWAKFDTVTNYLITVGILLLGGLLGALFATLIRRVMIENAELQFPESIAAGEIHKAGRASNTGAKYLFGAMGIGGLIQALGQLNFFATSWQKFVSFAQSTINLRSAGTVSAQGGTVLGAPSISPAFIGLGYIIGPKLAALMFGGGVLAWGLFVPIILYFSAPELVNQWTQTHPGQIPAASDWISWSTMIWKFVVKPISIGLMLVGTGFTLFKMRNNLTTGISSAFSNVKKSIVTDTTTTATARTAHDIHAKLTLMGIVLVAFCTFFVYYYFSQNFYASLAASGITVLVGFFFSATSGYLCGVVGSSSNPGSGLALSSLIISAIIMVAMGMSGTTGVAIVLAITAIICASSVAAGDLLQDLKVGDLLGGTPWRMQLGDIISIVLSALVMFIPLVFLNQGDINAGKMAAIPYDGGFGSLHLGAPQAGLMAFAAQGIVGGHMTWPLIIFGIFLGIGMILLQVRSPMLLAIGMYLSLDTTFAIFVGGMLKGIVEMLCQKKKLGDEQKSKIENAGILLASGFIAGEALIGLVLMGFAFFNVPLWEIFAHPSYLVSLLVLAFIGWFLVAIPLKHGTTSEQPTQQINM